jgi:tyrosine-protein phosphatase YwqE
MEKCLIKSDAEKIQTYLAAKKMAEELIKKGLVDFLGSDCHRMEHLLMIEKHLDAPIYDAIEKLKLLNPSL